MTFRLEELYQHQYKLDLDIQEKHGVTYENTLNKRLLAFYVELSELANATRCFKFWSFKNAEEKARLLDEYADALHFILSIGISQDTCVEEVTYFDLSEDLTSSFLICINLFNEYVLDKTFDKYIEVLSYFISMSTVLGFTSKEIEDAYLLKLEVNHNRVENNY